MKNSILVSILLLTSCASIHPGNFAKQAGESQNIPLVISGETIESELGSPYQLVQVTFENTSDTWVRIVESNISLDDLNGSKISVVVGNDLKFWAEAMEAQKKVDDQNKEILQASLALAGAGTMVGGSIKGNSKAVVAGSAVLAGSSVWSAADGITKSKKAANQAPAVPETHLYSPTTVPPKLFLRRWVLLNKPVTEEVHKLVFSIETEKSERATYVIAI